MITIKDVARAAQVSIATVSRVLNAYPHVRPEVRERVQKAVGAVGSFLIGKLVTRDLVIRAARKVGTRMAAKQVAVTIVPVHMIARIECRSSSGPTKRPESVMATMKSEGPRETCAFVASNASAIGNRKMGNDAIEVPMQRAWVAKPTPTMRQPRKGLGLLMGRPL